MDLVDKPKSLNTSINALFVKGIVSLSLFSS